MRLGTSIALFLAFALNCCLVSGLKIGNVRFGEDLFKDDTYEKVTSKIYNILTTAEVKKGKCIKHVATTGNGVGDMFDLPCTPHGVVTIASDTVMLYGNPDKDTFSVFSDQPKILIAFQNGKCVSKTYSTVSRHTSSVSADLSEEKCKKYQKKIAFILKQESKYLSAIDDSNDETPSKATGSADKTQTVSHAKSAAPLEQQTTGDPGTVESSGKNKAQLSQAQTTGVSDKAPAESSGNNKKATGASDKTSSPSGKKSAQVTQVQATGVSDKTSTDSASKTAATVGDKASNKLTDTNQESSNVVTFQTSDPYKNQQSQDSQNSFTSNYQSYYQKPGFSSFKIYVPPKTQNYRSDYTLDFGALNRIAQFGTL